MIRKVDLQAAARITIESASVGSGLTGEYLEPLDVDPQGLKRFVREWVKGRMDDGMIAALADQEAHAVFKAFLESGIAIGVAAQLAKDADPPANEGKGQQRATLTFEDAKGEEADSMTMEMRFVPGVSADLLHGGDLSHSASLRAVRDTVEFIHGRADSVTLTETEMSDGPEGGGERWKL